MVAAGWQSAPLYLLKKFGQVRAFMSRKAIEKINKNGVLLVFPIKNKTQPHSLWAELHPRTKMLWEWGDESHNKVAEMWMLMKRLSSCREVVYSKWYQGRATFFSRELFAALLCVAMRAPEQEPGLSLTAGQLLSTLESDSPLSTKELKKLTDLQGRLNEPMYSRGMKELFSQFLIVAFGEVDDGAFPSLAVGATKTLYEDLWQEAEAMDPFEAQKTIDRWMPVGSLFRKFFNSKILPKATLEPSKKLRMKK